MIIANTNRLTLRRFLVSDAPFILRLLNEPSYHSNIGDRGIRTLEQAEDYCVTVLQRSYLENQFGLYLVEMSQNQNADPNSAQPIGFCGLVNRDGLDGVDLGYALLPRYWGQGYAKEACLAVMSHARDAIGLDEVLAIVSQRNEASSRLLLRLGFVADGVFVLPSDDETLDLFRRNLRE